MHIFDYLKLSQYSSVQPYFLDPKEVLCDVKSITMIWYLCCASTIFVIYFFVFAMYFFIAPYFQLLIAFDAMLFYFALCVNKIGLFVQIYFNAIKFQFCSIHFYPEIRLFVLPFFDLSFFVATLFIRTTLIII